MNVVCLIGRITRDIELKKTAGGLSAISFTLAVDRPRSKEDATDFIPCAAWGKTAEVIAAHCHKGSLAGVTGALTSRSYEDKSGQKRTAYEVRVDQLQFLDKKADDSAKNDDFLDF